MRWIFRLIGVVVLVAVIAAGALLFLPKERIAAIAADQIRAQTGRDVTFTGGLGLTFWPVLGVETGPVQMSNAVWAGREPMIQAERLAIGVDAGALIGGEIKVRHIEAVRPVVRLSARADGTGNWQFETSGVPAAGGGGGSAGQSSLAGVTLDKLSISDARIVYTAEGAAPLDMGGMDLDLTWPDPGGPADFTLVVRPAGEDVAATGRVADVHTLIAGEVAPITARVETQGGALDFTGRANTSGDAAGRVTLSASDTAKMLGALGIGGVELPEGLGRRAEMTAELTVTRDMRVALRDLALGLDQNALTGAADLALGGDVPQVTAQLKAGALDLSAATGGADGSGGGDDAAAGSGWSTAPIDASALALMNGSIALAAESIDTGDFQLGPSRLTLRLDRARAVLEMTEVNVFGGKVAGELVANNRSGLSVGGNLTAADIAMEQFLKDTAGIERFSGAANASLKFLGVGQSMDAIMKSLSGSGAVNMGHGVIAGIDLDRLMRTGNGQGGTTVFDSFNATYAMDGGNLVNRDLELLLKNFRAEGDGRIGIGAQDIDYLFTPIALRVNSGQGLAIPIRIRGPWSGPRIVPDLSEALQLDVNGRVEAVRDDAEQRARDEVRQKLEEELDRKIEDGENVEEAIKDRLENELKQGLRGLLGGN
ncbi:AsmA family protein [Thalassococcus sp. S3]|uniref:AsmA family protein n=1 Tax=Thalassococcus sp. S3 TaxID=2017482 RepID=UPI001024197B|nr:AsmA family protein [Thalassococcus sp. S3]QBF30964.1 AsmA family protein [Thalassococcus sp. S3]